MFDKKTGVGIQNCPELGKKPVTQPGKITSERWVCRSIVQNIYLFHLENVTVFSQKLQTGMSLWAYFHVFVQEEINFI